MATRRHPRKRQLPAGIALILLPLRLLSLICDGTDPLAGTLK